MIAAMKEENSSMKNCMICGKDHPEEANYYGHNGYVVTRVPGKAGVLCRKNLANWGEARTKHITPTENRRSKNGSKATAQAADSKDVTDILTEIGETDSAVGRMLVTQALSGSANALKEILGKRAEAGQGERFEAFRRGEGTCPTCDLRPIWTLQFSLAALADMRRLIAEMDMDGLGNVSVEQTRSATSKQPAPQDTATYEEALDTLGAHYEEEARKYPRPPVTSTDGDGRDG